MIRAALVIVLLVTAGCAPFTRDAARALADADAHAANGDYTVALAAYDAYLTRYPEDDGAPRARAVRTMMAELVALRAQLATLRATHEAERARARGETAELAKVREELSVRQAEVARLREDLEALKRTDLQMERGRR